MKKVFSFQKKLAKNNDRDWFNDHKDEYQESEEEFREFIKILEELLLSHDQLDTSKTHRFRIYRDVRFSKDKTPYNLHRSVSYARATDALRGGYYVRLEPGGKSMIAGGFWRPEATDLLHIRKQISQDPETLREILNSTSIRSYFGELQGETLKTSPKGFDADDPAIDLLRHKGFILVHSFDDNEVLAKDFPKKVNEGFKKLRPFFDYMSEILTTDLNGQTLLNRT